MRTKVQEDVIGLIDSWHDIKAIEDFEISETEVSVEITTFDGSKYVRFNVMPNGDTDIIVFREDFRKRNSEWSMEEHGWYNTRPIEKPSGDESFDVVVENELKKEKETKKMINVGNLVANTLSDIVSEYVDENIEDIEERFIDAVVEETRERGYNAISDRIGDVIIDLAIECVDNTFDDSAIDSDVLAEALDNYGFFEE